MAPTTSAYHLYQRQISGVRNLAVSSATAHMTHRTIRLFIEWFIFSSFLPHSSAGQREQS